MHYRSPRGRRTTSAGGYIDDRQSVTSELFSRRVPQILGIYLAAGWLMLEFSDWAIGHFDLSGRLTDVVLAGVLVFLPLVVVAAWKYGGPRSKGETRVRRRGAVPRPRSGPKSIAVLPFKNMSDSPEMEYLSDGITDEIINTLARMENLQVASRTSAFVYKGKTADVRTIGEELNVDSILEGSVQKAGNRLRINTQLVAVADDYHLWSERFEREMEDVFAIEDEIAENVARALRVILPEKEKQALGRVPTSDVAAYDFYLKGRQFFHQSRKKSLDYARQMFRRAIEVDPEYALAWAGVADCGSLMTTVYPGGSAAEADLEEADHASLKALELDPDLAEAHAARGLTLFAMRRFEEAEHEFQAAIRLDSRQFEARYFYARACFQQGRLEDAARLFITASEVREDYQASFFAAQSLEALERTIEAKLQYRRALKVAVKHMELNPDDPRAATMQAVSHCRLGNHAEGLKWAERALAIDPEDAGVRYNVACLYALEGESVKAIDCLEQAVDAGFGMRDWVEQDPDLGSLRTHPRYQTLLNRM